MEIVSRPCSMITDYVTGKPVPDIGAEANRQAVERFLVDVKGYRREEIAVDMDLILLIAGVPYRTHLDLVVRVNGEPFMVIKCAAGSLGSRQTEVVAAARIISERPLPRAVASDGETALVFDPVRKKIVGEGLDQIPSPGEAKWIMREYPATPIPADRLEKEKIVFRSYDLMNVNVGRNR